MVERYECCEALKPCPFCGAMPRVWCDLTDWRGKPVYKPDANGYRPIAYILEAEHKWGCFIRHMDGMNQKGRITALNIGIILNTWNGRYEHE